MPDERPVRQRLRTRELATRSLDQRLALRFPRASARPISLVQRLPPSSRLRQAALRRAVELGTAAYNRRDLEAVAVSFDPELEYYPYREFVEGALAEPCYHGPKGYVAYIEATYEVWGSEVRLEPTELIDLGDRIVWLADMPMRAQASGVALTEKYACVADLRAGRIVRQQDYLDQAEALAAAGLSRSWRSSRSVAISALPPVGGSFTIQTR